MLRYRFLFQTSVENRRDGVFEGALWGSGVAQNFQGPLSARRDFGRGCRLGPSTPLLPVTHTEANTPKTAHTQLDFDAPQALREEARCDTRVVEEASRPL